MTFTQQGKQSLHLLVFYFHFVIKSIDFPHNLRHRGEKGDEVCQGEGDKVTVGCGVERLGSSHSHHHHQVPQDAHQEDAGLADCAHQSIKLTIVLRVRANNVLGLQAVLRTLFQLIKLRTHRNICHFFAEDEI